MNIGNSISNLAGSLYTPTTASPSAKPGAFDANSREFGPLAASAIGVAATAADAAGSVYSFSDAGLGKASSVVGAAVDAVSSAFGHAVDSARDALDTVEGGIESAGHEISTVALEGYHALQRGVGVVEDGVKAAYQKVSDVAHGVEHAVASAATTVEDAVESVAGEVGSAVSSASNYVAMGVGAGKQLLDAVA